MYIGLHVQYRLFLLDFDETWILLTDFRKYSQTSNFVKNRPVGAELFHADGQTDMTKLIVAFRNFACAPENQSLRPVAAHSPHSERHCDMHGRQCSEPVPVRQSDTALICQWLCFLTVPQVGVTCHVAVTFPVTLPQPPHCICLMDVLCRAKSVGAGDRR